MKFIHQKILPSNKIYVQICLVNLFSHILLFEFCLCGYSLYLLSNCLKTWFLSYHSSLPELCTKYIIRNYSSKFLHITTYPAHVLIPFDLSTTSLIFSRCSYQYPSHKSTRCFKYGHHQWIPSNSPPHILFSSKSVKLNTHSPIYLLSPSPQ